MGPWLCSHGRPWKGAESTQWLELLQWGRGFAATEGKGAGPNGQTGWVLQWGRGFAATEGQEPGAVGDDRRVASMWPWLCSHGRGACPPADETRDPRFNGAVALQPRKAGRRSCRRQRDGCFNGAVALQPRKAGEQRLCPRDLRHASMGPWLCSHGRGRFRSRLTPRGQSDICEHTCAQSTSSKPIHHHGLRKPFHTSRLDPRERPPGFSHHVAARCGLSNKPNCQGPTGSLRVTAS